MKTLCELDRLRKTDIDAYARLVDAPTHLCKKCGRAANRKKLVCKPHRIERPETSELPDSSPAEDAADVIDE